MGRERLEHSLKRGANSECFGHTPSVRRIVILAGWAACFSVLIRNIRLRETVAPSAASNRSAERLLYREGSAVSSPLKERPKCRDFSESG